MIAMGNSSLKFISRGTGKEKGAIPAPSSLELFDYWPGSIFTTSLKITMPANNTRQTNAAW